MTVVSMKAALRHNSGLSCIIGEDSHYYWYFDIRGLFFRDYAKNIRGDKDAPIDLDFSVNLSKRINYQAHSFCIFIRKER